MLVCGILKGINLSLYDQQENEFDKDEVQVTKFSRLEVLEPKIFT